MAVAEVETVMEHLVLEETVAVGLVLTLELRAMAPRTQAVVLAVRVKGLEAEQAAQAS